MSQFDAQQPELIAALKRIIEESANPTGRAGEHHADPEKAALAKALLACATVSERLLHPFDCPAGTVGCAVRPTCTCGLDYMRPVLSELAEVLG